jgi:hypothetical protein
MRIDGPPVPKPPTKIVEGKKVADVNTNQGGKSKSDLDQQDPSS